jgi:hypothetical protein
LVDEIKDWLARGASFFSQAHDRLHDHAD